MGKGTIIAQGSETLGDKQTAFDAELTAVEAAFFLSFYLVYCPLTPKGYVDQTT
jgi:hypothetical protein